MRSPKLLKSVLVLSAVALLSSVALLSIAPRLRADDAAAPVGFPTAVKEHELLRKFVGEWESECQGTFGEDGQERASQAFKFQASAAITI